MTLRRRLRAALPPSFSTSSSPLGRCGAPPPPGHCAPLYRGAVWIRLSLVRRLPFLRGTSLPFCSLRRRCWPTSCRLVLLGRSLVGSLVELRGRANWPLWATSRTSATLELRSRPRPWAAEWLNGAPIRPAWPPPSRRNESPWPAASRDFATHLPAWNRSLASAASEPCRGLCSGTSLASAVKPERRTVGRERERENAET